MTARVMRVIESVELFIRDFSMPFPFIMKDESVELTERMRTFPLS